MDEPLALKTEVIFCVSQVIGASGAAVEKEAGMGETLSGQVKVWPLFTRDSV